jgi:hypothetical protein
MINHNLASGCKFIPLTLDGTNFTVAAGTDGAVVDGTEIDMLGFTGCLIIFNVGAIAANGVFTSFVKNSDTAATYGSGTIDKIGSSLANSADTDDNKIIYHDIYKPQRRYLRASYQRTVGNVTLLSATAILYNAVNAPITQTTTLVEVGQVLNNPTPSAS